MIHQGTSVLHLHSTLVDEALKLRAVRYIADQLLVHEAVPRPLNHGYTEDQRTATMARLLASEVRSPELDGRPSEKTMRKSPGKIPYFNNYQAKDAQVLAAAPEAVRQAAAAAVAAADAAAASRAARQDAARLAAWKAAATALPSFPVKPQTWFHFGGAPQSNAMHTTASMQAAAARQAAARAALGQHAMPQRNGF